MRAIRFRAFDKIEGKMWAPIIDIDGVPCAKHPITCQAMRMDGDLLDPIMQYTGLKDKNGADVFEDDFVKVYYDGYNDEVYQVIWGGNEYPAFDLLGWEGEANGLSEIVCGSDGFEVIGNVHSNPELLES